MNFFINGAWMSVCIHRLSNNRTMQPGRSSNSTETIREAEISTELPSLFNRCTDITESEAEGTTIEQVHLAFQNTVIINDFNFSYYNCKWIVT